MLNRFSPAIFLCGLLLVSGCATFYNPATQSNEMLLIDTPYEVSLGADMSKEIEQKMKVYNNPSMQQRLETIGRKVAAASDRQDIAYHFKIIDDKELNAFAIPGGFIYANRGLMESATDDELAAVLAHEVGHVAARHGVKRLQAVLGYELILSLALGSKNKQETMKDAVSVIFNLITLGYSRQDETLADTLSVRYSRRSGFNPRGMVTFFKKLENASGSKSSHYNPVFLSSHPPIEERIRHVEDQISHAASLP
jgi:beta-barrel assembly-enhancing protease